MPSDPAGQGFAEILTNVRIMREYAVLGRYQTAKVYAQGLIDECENQMRLDPGQQEALRRLRDDLSKERDLITAIYAELQQFSGVGHPSGGGGGRFGGNHHAVSDDDPPQHSPWDNRAVGGHPPPNYVVAPPAAPSAVHGAGDRNEHLFGDKDRFGPGYDPSAAPQRNRWGGARAADREERDRPARRVASQPQLRPGRDAAARDKERRKEPLPRAARPRSPRAGARGKEEPQQGEDGEKPRYQARKGEEDMSEVIHGEIVDLKKMVSFDSVAGHEDAKKLLEEAVVLPLILPDFFQGIRRAWRGVMMFGPPGTGKTLLAKAVASQCKTTFFNVSVATLTSKWRGESEKLVRLLFEIARHYAPSTIFIDEIDSLCQKRGGEGEHEASRRAKTELLVQMDGMATAADDTEDTPKVVMVLGATNHPWEIDEAMRRRLEKRIYIPCPDLKDRVELFHINSRSIKTSCSEADWEQLARLCEGYSGADITNVCRDASMSHMRRVLAAKNRSEIEANAKDLQQEMKNAPIGYEDFAEAVKNTPSSITPDMVRRYEMWIAEFNQEKKGGG
eukprot:Hpha_TRINITY_DN16467_c4_g10::TRINITY_DN16467_c4_g10_i1::g.160875::m.160875/K07767/KATNA1; katanin p60 ATPase-containing subunit A1